jgi:hypothetical protein
VRQWGAKRKVRLTIVVRLSLLYRLGAEADAFYPVNGHVAEWLRSGLQIRVPRFNSGRGLQPSLLALCKAGALCYRPDVNPDLFPGSSAVERSTVNRNVAGSIPAQGANSSTLCREPAADGEIFFDTPCGQCDPQHSGRVPDRLTSPLEETKACHFRSHAMGVLLIKCPNTGCCVR